MNALVFSTQPFQSRVLVELEEASAAEPNIKLQNDPAAVPQMCSFPYGRTPNKQKSNRTEQVEQLDVNCLRQGGVGKQARKSMTVRECM